MKIRIKRSVIVILLCISIVIRPGINIDGLKVKASPVVSDNYEDDGNVVNLFNSPSQTQSATSAAITFADYPITIDDSVFPDDNFRSYILTNIDLNKDGKLSYEEMSSTTSMFVNNRNIHSLQGIEMFLYLRDFHCGGNPLGTLDISKNTELTSLYCFNNELTAIDVSKNTKLEYFSCDGNQIAELDLSNNENLVRLDCHDNVLSELKLNKNELVRELICEKNDIKTLDLSNNPFLIIAYEYGTQNIHDSYCEYNRDNYIIKLDVTVDLSETNTSAINDLEITEDIFPDANFRNYILENVDRNKDGSLSLLEICNTTSMVVNGRNIHSLQGIEVFRHLRDFHCGDNPLGAIDISQNKELTSLYCFMDELTSVDVSNNTKLEYFSCDGNQITSLDLSNNTKLVRLDCHNNNLTSLDLSNNPYVKELYCFGNNISVLDISRIFTALKAAYLEGDKTEYTYSYKYVYNKDSISGILEIDKNQVVNTEISHLWGSPSYTWSNDNSTVTAIRICRNDDSHIETETVSTTAVTRAAICFEEGAVTYTSGTFKNPAFEVQTKTEVIPALGHDWGEVTYTWSDDNHTLTAVRKCRNDASHVETEVVNVTTVVTKAAICIEPGVLWHASDPFENNAFQKQIKTEEIPAIGHDWNDVIYGWTDDNSKLVAIRICKNDSSHIEAEVVNVTSVVTKAAICLEPGVLWHDSGNFKNQAFKRQIKTEEIPAIGHNWGDVVYTWSDDNSQVTATRVCLNDSEHIESETSKVVKQTRTRDDGTEFYEYEAVFINIAFEKQIKIVEINGGGQNDDNPTESGICGLNARWDYYADTGLLRIYGEGNIDSTESWNDFRQNIEKVIIESGITSIGDNTFENCENLTDIVLSEGLVNIGQWAFAGIEKMNSIYIPASVTDIERFAFEHCAGLENIIVDSDNPTYSSEDGVLFNKDKTKLLRYPQAKSGDYTVPNSVLVIEKDSFEYCSKLSAIEIPDTTTISEADGDFNVFYGCIGLADEDGFVIIRNVLYQYVNNCTSLTVPDGVIALGFNAFGDCYDLKTLYIPKGLKFIGLGVLVCELTDIYYDGTASEWFEVEIGPVNPALDNATIHYTSEIKKGDVNGDGVVNAKDVTVLRRYIAGGWSVTIVEANSDINGDGTINAKDVTMLRRALAGGWGIVLE